MVKKKEVRNSVAMKIASTIEVRKVAQKAAGKEAQNMAQKGAQKLTSVKSSSLKPLPSSSNVSTPLQVGVITHYYSKIKVGVVEVKKTLQVGDALQIAGRGRSFAQIAKSMQMEHQPLSVAKKGQIIGMKVKKPVKPKDVVYRF